MMAKQRRRMLTRVLLGILLILNSAALLAQQEDSAQAVYDFDSAYQPFALFSAGGEVSIGITLPL